VTGILVDSNVLLDVLTQDPAWFAWSSEALSLAAEREILLINPIIYAEVSIGFSRIEDLDAALPEAFFRRDALPWEAGFLAGKCFLKYRRAGGQRRSPLPDFYVGGHAAIRGHALLTRDAATYRSYFPSLELISP
jgi:predicted nucleic acid-binding protein